MESYLVRLVTPKGVTPHCLAWNRFDPGFWQLCEFPFQLTRLDAERLRAHAAQALGALVQVVGVSG
jgi:hypothetical protein